MNQFRIHITLAILLLGYMQSFGQLVALNDTSLRDKLIADYSQVMQGDSLDTIEAANFTGYLNLRDASISDASGVEYFTSAHSIDLATNQLTTLPDISANVGLTNLYLSNNNLTSLPDLSSFTLLENFHVMNNQLTTLPSLSGLTLKELYCSGNQIAVFPDLDGFPVLEELVIGDNDFTNELDFSKCPELRELHIHRLGLDSIQGLSTLDKLEVLFAWGNELLNISGLENNTVLEILAVHNNDITVLPTLTNKPSLNYLTFENNRLTFEDVLPTINNISPSKLSYSPQKSISISNQSERAFKPLDIEYPEVSPHGSNVYVWYKEGEKIDSSFSSILSFSALSEEDSGKYVLNVYNSLASELILISDTFKISVEPCLEVDFAGINPEQVSCEEAYTLDLNVALIEGGTSPFSYQLIGNDTIVTASKVIERIQPGEYTLVVEDANNCKVPTQIIVDPLKGCSPIITPNGDGIADTYYFDTSGRVEVYDMGRNLLRSMYGPISWDGTDQDGNTLDAGYYIILYPNGSSEQISVIY